MKFHRYLPSYGGISIDDRLDFHLKKERSCQCQRRSTVINECVGISSSFLLLRPIQSTSFSQNFLGNFNKEIIRIPKLKIFVISPWRAQRNTMNVVERYPSFCYTSTSFRMSWYQTMLVFWFSLCFMCIYSLVSLIFPLFA